MAHVRSGSSLMTHILCTNDDILGFGEYSYEISDEDDLETFNFDVRRKSREFFSKPTYITNQINDSYCFPDKRLLKLKRLKFIFLIRQPQEAISSMYQLTKRFDQTHLTLEKLVDQYCKQVNYLLKLKDAISEDQYVFLTYESLIRNPENQLNRLSSFLKLNQPLSPEYNLQKFTHHSGDPSEHICSQKIKTTKSPQIKLDKVLLERAQTVYNKALVSFKKEN
ncbi:sulfotransferase [uncultured Winogradskyella sp.]|uniref:sulfotransferase n=1 Tax=uncultured Winogradskyella sp. TaxID=395353 RepID=UPI0026196399|nr:sulfotransferase [uncultured Winogradskyella sp.]